MLYLDVIKKKKDHISAIKIDPYYQVDVIDPNLSEYLNTFLKVVLFDYNLNTTKTIIVPYQSKFNYEDEHYIESIPVGSLIDVKVEVPPPESERSSHYDILKRFIAARVDIYYRMKTFKLISVQYLEKSVKSYVFLGNTFLTEGVIVELAPYVGDPSWMKLCIIDK